MSQDDAPAPVVAGVATIEALPDSLARELPAVRGSLDTRVDYRGYLLAPGEIIAWTNDGLMLRVCGDVATITGWKDDALVARSAIETEMLLEMLSTRRRHG
jgi:hypothetical protein